MEINIKFQELESLRKRLNAPERSLSFDKPIEKMRDIERELKTAGIVVSEGDIQSSGPYLTYKGEHLAILYILNSTAPSSDLINNEPSKSTPPKFHLTWCRTLDRMKRNKRFERYVLSRSPSNLFRVEALEHEPSAIRRLGERHMLDDIRLYPCQNCLNDLQYKSFTFKSAKPLRLKKVADFVVKDFLDENDGNLTVMRHLPKTLARNAKSGGYTSDFPEISRRLREEKNWTCSKCNVDMTGNKGGLHTHHINGVKSDNSTRNLKVLCALCHKGIDAHHATMHVKPSIERYILANRNTK
jgi:hypothetical protein